MKKAISLLAIASLVLSFSIASASSLTFGNSEYSIVYSNGITWDSAKQAAESTGGHLVTVTSAEESNFLRNTLLKNQEKAYWLGAYQTGDENRQNPTGNWNWVTGENWSFTDWSSVEPNNAGNIDEMHLSADSRYGFQWNDEGAAISRMINGYVVEKNLDPAPTPLPAAVWLLGAGLAGVFGLRKKFGKQ